MVPAQAHGVEPLPDLEPLHLPLDDQRDVAVPSVDLAAGEGGEDRALPPVADEALLAVQKPGAVRLPHGPALDVVGVRAGVPLCEREAGELAAGGEVGEEALLLLVGAEHVDALEADRLGALRARSTARRRSGRRSRTPARSRSGKALAPVLLRHVEAHQAPLAEARGRRRRRSSRPPRSCGVPAGSPASWAEAISARTRSCSAGSDWGHGNTRLRMDLAQEQRLCERGAGLLRTRPVDPGLRRGLHHGEPTPNAPTCPGR